MNAASIGMASVCGTAHSRRCSSASDRRTTSGGQRCQPIRRITVTRELALNRCSALAPRRWQHWLSSRNQVARRPKRGSRRRWPGTPHPRAADPTRHRSPPRGASTVSTPPITCCLMMILSGLVCASSQPERYTPVGRVDKTVAGLLNQAPIRSHPIRRAVHLVMARERADKSEPGQPPRGIGQAVGQTRQRTITENHHHCQALTSCVSRHSRGDIP